MEPCAPAATHLSIPDDDNPDRVHPDTMRMAASILGDTWMQLGHKSADYDLVSHAVEYLHDAANNAEQKAHVE